ncbi:MAG: alpha/beta hydrolase [Acidobacteria bacterium]|nr:alpha/beta hydrolase [Acidobacteriota bacterium]MDW7984155.1 alpha/beta hydrolase [Acidobacteriota bacterium]
MAYRQVVWVGIGVLAYALFLWGMRTVLPALALIWGLRFSGTVPLPIGGETLSMAGGWAVDRWFSHAAPPGRPCVVVVHGLTPDGKDDPRLKDFARALAWSGLDVYVPHVPALAEFRFDPRVVPQMKRLFQEVESRCPTWALIGISVGAGPALRALESAPSWPRLRAVATVGAYADACRLMAVGLIGERLYGWDTASVRQAARYALEGWGRTHGWSEEMIRHQVERLLACRSVEEVDAWCRQAPPDFQAVLRELSPIAHTSRPWNVPTWILHSPSDPAIPIEESRRLAQALRSPTVRFVEVPVLTHVETDASQGRTWWAWKSLWSATWGFYRALN